MRYFHPERDEYRELALDDVFILPNYFDGESRLEVDLTPRDVAGLGSHPVVSANMNAVTGKRMAETMARYGGLGILPQDMAMETVERIVAHIQSAHPRFDTPLTVTPDATLRDVRGIIRKRSHGMVVVVDEHRRPIGIVTHTDLKEQDQYTPVSRLMSTRLVTLPTDISNQDAFERINAQRVNAAPVVDDDGRLVGILEKEAVVRMEILRPTVDEAGRLAVAAAIGISADAGKVAGRLQELGLKLVVIDTAHGHQRRMIDAIRDVRETVGDEMTIVAGNVCTREGTKDLIDAGADIVKVNVGPGAMCTTRMQTGVGRPSFSSVLNCAREARKHGRCVWADGGVRQPRDVALYLTAGASRVMIGTMLAGTFESPGDIKEDREGRLYKVNFGMASARAVADRTVDADPFERAKKGFFREGISFSRIYLKEGRDSVGAILIGIITGIQSTMTYVSAQTLAELHDKAVIGIQTRSGFVEGTAHGLIWD
jgi:IMP dehydrogenase